MPESPGVQERLAEPRLQTGVQIVVLVVMSGVWLGTVYLWTTPANVLAARGHHVFQVLNFFGGLMLSPLIGLLSRANRRDAPRGLYIAAQVAAWGHVLAYLVALVLIFIAVVVGVRA